MGLREKFRKKVQARRLAKDEKNKRFVNMQIEWTVASVQGRLDKNSPDKVITCSPIAGLQHPVTCKKYYDEKTLPAYRRLHEICKAADVRVEMDETVTCNSGMLPRIYASVTIRLDQSYNSSPDANFFMPKKPAGVQPSPGL
jgi:hypothetical protein